jgi:hypothetical protein
VKYDPILIKTIGMIQQGNTHKWFIRTLRDLLKIGTICIFIKKPHSGTNIHNVALSCSIGIESHNFLCLL